MVEGVWAAQDVQEANISVADVEEVEICAVEGAELVWEAQQSCAHPARGRA